MRAWMTGRWSGVALWVLGYVVWAFNIAFVGYRAWRHEPGWLMLAAFCAGLCGSTMWCGSRMWYFATSRQDYLKLKADNDANEAVIKQLAREAEDFIGLVRQVRTGHAKIVGVLVEHDSGLRTLVEEDIPRPTVN